MSTVESRFGVHARRAAFLAHSEENAGQRPAWRRKARFFHEEDNRFLSFLIPKGARVLEIGCGTGDTLAALEPSYGLGIDFSPKMIERARVDHPDLQFRVADVENSADLEAIDGEFDFILVLDTLGALNDCQATLHHLHRFCGRHTRLVIGYYSHFWQPALWLAESLGLRAKPPETNVLSPADVCGLCQLAGFDPVRQERRLLSPFSLCGIGRLINRFVATLPGVRALGLRHYVVARSNRHLDDGVKSATVVVPARNERGNIEPAVIRLPRFCDDIELIFVEGHSQDGTWEEMERVKAAYPDWQIKVMKQPGKGKADAVFAAFDAARGDVLMILDADLTMPPEQLPKFWNAIKEGHGEFINGSRLVYPMENDAMRLLNLVANKCFSHLFSWLLSQRYTDTLCGTKALRRADYEHLKQGRAYFGDFDPFGDFDLIFGAAKLNLKTAEIPIRYAARVYGETQISRFRHGLMLLRMAAFAYLKVKAI